MMYLICNYYLYHIKLSVIENNYVNYGINEFYVILELLLKKYDFFYNISL